MAPCFVWTSPYFEGTYNQKRGIFNSKGKYLKTDGTVSDFDLYQEDSRQILQLDDMDIVYASPEGTTVRLLDVSATVPLRVDLRRLSSMRMPLRIQQNQYICQLHFAMGNGIFQNQSVKLASFW